MMIPFERSYWVLPGRFLAGRIPSSQNIHKIEDNVKGLVRLKIDYVINLTEPTEQTFEGKLLNDYTPTLLALAQQAQHQVEVMRMPIKDLSVPSVEFMKRILDTIDGIVQAGKSVYVHCWGGVGRTGTVVGCFLQRHGYTDSHTVLPMIEYLKRTTDLVHRLSPETDEQRAFVCNWQKGM
ncbi:MAG: dual specificity protein phosphatase family protein [Raineya sp.]|nr:dual specificity protein phosphatase family protein [Raineya sp.]